MDTIPKSYRYTCIHMLSSRFQVWILIHIAKVSLSGYYKYKMTMKMSQTQFHKDQQSLETIKSLVERYNQKHGYRIITMLLKSEYKILMNHKKVYRLMKQYNLLAKIRRKNPYKHILKATQEHRTCKNILQRKFGWIIPRQKLWTDVSYLYYNGTKAYISILKDMTTGEIISHKISNNLWLWFVLDTIKDSKEELRKWTLIHSDQWFHYTHPSYQCLLKDIWIVQSMSRRWNCLDNAPTESFFGHMKDEIDIWSCKSFQELEKYLENYIYYYNNQRPQWTRKKMTPVEYRNHLLKN
jgi:transposase InsO family protein